MAIPATLPTNPFETKACFEHHLSVDLKVLFKPSIWAGRQMFDLLKEVKGPDNLEKIGITQTILPRLLLVAQSIVCLVALPFKLLIAVFTGIDAIINSKDLKAWANMSYAMSSLGTCALAVPGGILASCMSVNAIQNALEAVKAMDEAAVEASLAPRLMATLVEASGALHWTNRS